MKIHEDSSSLVDGYEHYILGEQSVRVAQWIR